jgi:predicted PurR-regulated permease PerM
MEGKAKFIFPVLMAGVMAFLMTALITWLNLGFPPNYLALWIKAFVIAWPAAAIAAFIAIPLARRATATIVRIVEGR